MNRIDHALVAGLVLVLAVIALAIGAPAFSPGVATPSPSPAIPETPPYREGAIGIPISVNPLGARTQVDRDLVALAFSGLVRRGQDGTLIPDLAARWSVDVTGRTWTFELRPDATWHDGEPVTAEDVAFTVRILRDPTYTGPGAGSWREVTATATGPRTVRFDMGTPLGGFLELATQPIAPAHLLGDVPIELLVDDPFGRAPIGSGPFAVVELDDDHALLEPAASAARPAVDGPASAGDSGPLPTDTLATPGPTRRPAMALPYLTRLEFRYFDDPAALAAAFEGGQLDAASGLPAAEAARLGATAGARLLRYPGTTLTTVALNLRPSHLELRDARVRQALLQAIDRPAIHEAAFAGLAAQADSPVPPTSWAFDAAASPALAHDPKAAAAGLTKAGWKQVDGRWRVPGGKAAYELELVAPDASANPVLRAVAEAVAKDWEAFGLTVKLVGAEPGTLVGEILPEGRFTAAVVDVSIGHDPDLYPLLASSQTQTGGLNVIGLQDPALDKLLDAARRPGTAEARRAAYVAVQAQLAAGVYLLPIAFADEVVVVREGLSGMAVREVADASDRFGDVLTWRLANGR